MRSDWVTAERTLISVSLGSVSYIGFEPAHDVRLLFCMLCVWGVPLLKELTGE